MKFKIDEKIFDKFPELNIGLVIARDVDNKGFDEEIMQLTRNQERELRVNFNTETLSQNSKIDAWRKAYALFGEKPKKYQCSVENLYRIILEGNELRYINKLVDAYNYISIKHTIPLGGDDIDKVDGNILLKFAEGNEIFRALNSEEIKNPKQGEVVYIDDKEVLCRRWNWRECNKTKMTEETRNVMLVAEGLQPFTREDIEQITNELAMVIQKFCGGKTTTYILNKTNSGVEI